MSKDADRNRKIKVLEEEKWLAQFNLDFEKYKKKVKEAAKNRKIDISKIKFPDNYCVQEDNNTFLIVGIIMIVFAFAMTIMIGTEDYRNSSELAPNIKS